VSRLVPPESEYSKSRLIVLILVAAFLALFLFGQMLVCGLAVDASWCRLWPHLSMESIIGEYTRKYLRQAADQDLLERKRARRTTNRIRAASLDLEYTLFEGARQDTCSPCRSDAA
jgi:hypothetical protein